MFTNKVVPLVKPVPKVVLKVNEQNFAPIKDPKIQPITKNNTVYIPVREIVDPKLIKSPVPSKQKVAEPVPVIKVANISYIPLKVVPKVYAPIFTNKPVAATKENAKNTCIKVNGNTFTPILNETKKPVVINQQTYIPVRKVDPVNVGTKNVIAPNQVKNVSTIKIGNATYIPITVVPKVYRPVFCYRVPLKPPTPAPITRAIKVNNNLFTPITKGPVKPIEVEGTKYVPVKPAPVDAIIRKPV